MNSDARWIMNNIPTDVLEWRYSEDITDEEKAAHPEHETTGGYLRVYTPKETAQMWWDGLSENRKNIILNIPNFDADIFEEITGITKINLNQMVLLICLELVLISFLP